jgi:hypothetical protein
MGLAERKMELLEIVVNADEETTGKLIALAHQLTNEKYKFSDEEIAKFEKTRDDFFASGEKGYSVEEAHDMIRNKLRK